MNLEERIARTKELISRREEIDVELSQLLGIAPKSKRGRPSKQNGADETHHAGTPEAALTPLGT